MIRPITVVTFLVACGSGMYLYHTKHKVRVLDSEIEHVVHDTEHVREQTRILRAEWTLLDQPDRLQQLAAQFLTLQPTKPSQFVAMADLDSRLPPPLPPHVDTPAPAEPVQQPETPALVASGEPPPAPAAPAAPAKPAPVAVRHETPMVAEAVPPRPVVRAAARIVEPARPVASAIRAPAVVPPEPRPMPRYAAEEARAEPVYHPSYRPAYARPPAPIPVAAPAYGGSMLGMARSAAPPAPTPPAPTQWVNWNR